jgi:hypothetical protein
LIAIRALGLDFAAQYRRENDWLVRSRWRFPGAGVLAPKLTMEFPQSYLFVNKDPMQDRQVAGDPWDCSLHRVAPAQGGGNGRRFVERIA